MAQRDHGELPENLQEVDAQLRARTHNPSSVELDDLKRRTMAQATRQLRPKQGKGTLMRSKIVTMLLVAGFAVSGGGAAVLAAKGGDGNGNGKNNAGNSQYKPGKGCGDKNHTHTGPPGNPGNTDCPPQSGKKK